MQKKLRELIERSSGIKSALNNEEKTRFFIQEILFKFIKHQPKSVKIDMEKKLTEYKNLRPDILVFDKKDENDQVKCVGVPGNMLFIIEVKKYKAEEKNKNLQLINLTSPLMKDI